MVIVFALGNFGDRYEKTRHNAGVMALNTFRNATPEANWSEWRENSAKKFITSEGEFGGKKFILARTTTFMNVSGVSFNELIKNTPDNTQIIILHDEIDLPIGEYKVVHDRGAGGHNGVQSIFEVTGTQAYTRVRIGVAPLDENGDMKKPAKDDVADFVLRDFTPDEKVKLEQVMKDVVGELKKIE